MELPFFSIIIPAHNEENYIVDTLVHLKHLEYPIERYEVIVVENASTDATLQKIHEHAPAHFQIVSDGGKGVSRARNRGYRAISALSEWVMFLDADTLLKPLFLIELATYLRPHHAVGTATLRPFPSSPVARTWFHIHDIVHKVTSSTESLIIVRRTVADQISFDEGIEINEDFAFTLRASKSGHFFVFPTRNAFSSTRRYLSGGWLKTHLFLATSAMLPRKIKAHIKYPVIR